MVLRARERMLLIIADNDGLEEDKIRKAFGEQHPDVSRSSPFLIDQLIKLGQIERQTREAEEGGEKANVLLITDEGERKAEELRQIVVSGKERPAAAGPEPLVEEAIAVEEGAGIPFKLMFPATVVTMYEFARSAGHTKVENFNDWLIECATLTFNQVYGCQIVMRGFAPVA